MFKPGDVVERANDYYDGINNYMAEGTRHIVAEVSEDGRAIGFVGDKQHGWLMPCSWVAEYFKLAPGRVAVGVGRIKVFKASTALARKR